MKDKKAYYFGHPYWDIAERNAQSATWWTLLMARLFGQPYGGGTLTHEMVAHEWRGVSYLTTKREINGEM